MNNFMKTIAIVLATLTISTSAQADKGFETLLQNARSILGEKGYAKFGNVLVNLNTGKMVATGTLAQQAAVVGNFIPAKSLILTSSKTIPVLGWGIVIGVESYDLYKANGDLGGYWNIKKKQGTSIKEGTIRIANSLAFWK